MTLRPAHICCLLMIAVGLAGCQSARFGSSPSIGSRPLVPVGSGSDGAPRVVYSEPGSGAGQAGIVEDDFGPSGPVASGPITAEPLPPPAGAFEPSPLPQGTGQPGTLSSDVTAGGGIIDMSGQSSGQAPQQLAARTPEPTRATPAGRLGPVGSWRLRDATGTTCRLSLSSAPALDLYKASASGCSNRDLSRITAWDNRDGEIYLYQPGGTVAARLRPGGEGYEGVLTKSGATIGMAR